MAASTLLLALLGLALLQASSAALLSKRLLEDIGGLTSTHGLTGGDKNLGETLESGVFNGGNALDKLTGPEVQEVANIVGNELLEDPIGTASKSAGILATPNVISALTDVDAAAKDVGVVTDLQLLEPVLIATLQHISIMLKSHRAQELRNTLRGLNLLLGDSCVIGGLHFFDGCHFGLAGSVCRVTRILPGLAGIGPHHPGFRGLLGLDLFLGGLASLRGPCQSLRR